MASNTNYVCFACRTAQRRPKTFKGAVLCPQCGRAGLRLSYKLAIPPKHRPQAWKALQRKMQRFAEQQQQAEDAYCLSRRSELQAEIQRLTREHQRYAGHACYESSRIRRRLDEAEQALQEAGKMIYVRRILNGESA